MSERKASSYALKVRQGKVPFGYSEDYRQWRGEVLKNGACGTKALMLACQHAKRFGVFREDCQPK